ncbi:hypothetical protein A1D50_06320 [Salmonella enterica]|nr:hypothetical protein [Salmonella enterica]ECL7326587.1 hypothetical protein [Salmonella enterica subsp. enterica serovar Waycross]EDT4116823.1 hypothetical protein [Salmonella enterica subsp. enterica serovar Uzaramo]EDW1902327.1 hypothetical protein [Salmonella enterica subsp. enterica serovar Lingwala]EED3354344.1 hypothetical protein [Salmonella enterica subsp. enterica]EEE1151828.1 hypothetical protein [Salmonella enterica subsp. enterica serovar Teko]EEL9729759.1 hypothetical protein 
MIFQTFPHPSLLNENLLKEKIISLNIFCSISTYSRINVRRWRKNLMSRNIDSQQTLLLVHIPPFCQAILERHQVSARLILS